MVLAAVRLQDAETEHNASSDKSQHVRGYNMYSKLETLLANHHEVLWCRLEDWLNCHTDNKNRFEKTLRSWEIDDDVSHGVVPREHSELITQDCVDETAQGLHRSTTPCSVASSESNKSQTSGEDDVNRSSTELTARSAFGTPRRKPRGAFVATGSFASDDAAGAADRAIGRPALRKMRSQLEVEDLYKDIDRKVMSSVRHVSTRFASMYPVGKSSWTRCFIESSTFDCLVMFLVITNCMYIGIQLEYMSHNPSNNISREFGIISTSYWAAFLAELILRISVYGKSFFTSRKSMGWNYLDTFLVVTSSMEMAFSYGVTYGQATESDESAVGNLYILRLIRLLRLARIFRVLRVLKFFRQLRVFVKSIGGTLKSLVLALLLLAIIIYFFATIFTNAYMEVASPDPELEKSFGSLSRTAYSLFLCITAGANWGDVIAPLTESTSLVYTALFMCYISFIYFAVLNVMTGVFCQNAIETAEQDDDTVILELLEQKQDITKRLQSIFHLSLLCDEEAEFTAEQFVERLHDDQLKAWFASIDIEVRDAWTLFKLLDGDRTGSCSITEFVEGCLYLRGSARQLAIAELSQEIKWIMKRLNAMSYMIEEMGYIMHGCDETWEPPRVSDYMISERRSK